MRSIGSMIAILGMLALAGCGATTGAAGTLKPQLPDLPPPAVAKCARPLAAVGDDLGVLAARWKATAVCEGGKRAALIVFYGDLREGLAGE